MNDATLPQRARAAGIEVAWTDAQGKPRMLSPATIEALLQALGPHATPSPPAWRVVSAGAPLGVAQPPREAFCVDTQRHLPLLCDAQGRVRAPDRPGHYMLAFGAREERLAVTPARCFGVCANPRFPSPSILNSWWPSVTAHSPATSSNRSAWYAEGISPCMT